MAKAPRPVGGRGFFVGLLEEQLAAPYSKLSLFLPLTASLSRALRAQCSLSSRRVFPLRPFHCRTLPRHITSPNIDLICPSRLGYPLFCAPSCPLFYTRLSPPSVSIQESGEGRGRRREERLLLVFCQRNRNLVERLFGALRGGGLCCLDLAVTINRKNKPWPPLSLPRRPPELGFCPASRQP